MKSVIYISSIVLLSLFFITPARAEIISNRRSSPFVYDRMPSSRTAVDNQARKMVVVIDPGHGGTDLGVIGQGTASEKKITLSIAKYLQETVSKSLPMIDIYLTRQGDVYISNSIRTEFIVDKKADLFLSLHIDGSFNSRLSGMSVNYYTPHTNETNTDDQQDVFDPASSILLAESMARNLQKELQLPANVDINKYPSILLKNVTVPAIILNLGFLTNPVSEARLKMEKVQMEIARSIASGLDEYYRIWSVRRVDNTKSKAWYE